MYEVEIPAKVTAKSGDEVDVLSRKARVALKWQRGEVRRVKTGINRRARRETRAALRAVRN